VAAALVDAGGNIYAYGQPPGGPWRVGIRHPRREELAGGMELTDAAVATSGDYERFFEEEGVRYHHILDPRTGYPARGLAGVTIFCEDPMLADALSTTVFVLGWDKGFAFAAAYPGVEALLIDDTGRSRATRGLAEGLTLAPRP